MSGKLLQLQVIYKGKTESTFHQKFAKIRNSFFLIKNHWSNKKRLYNLMMVFCYLTLKNWLKQTMELFYQHE